MGSISTRMTERFGCRHPFASAGMAFAGGTADAFTLFERFEGKL